MRRMPVCALLGLASCQTYVVDFENPSPLAVPDYQQSQASMWLGIKEVSAPLKVECAEGPARIVVRRSPMDFLVHFLVGGVYTRYTAEGYCVKKRS